jgi:alpha-L-rhamnosidase
MLLYRTEYPSWLYPVTQGATTIWERWDGQKPDGSFQDPGMNSFNHYAYGAIGDWLYRRVAGIDPYPGEPGFRSFIIKPHPGGEMNDVKASYDSPYGKIRSEWRIEDGRFYLSATVPVNTRARIYIPGRGMELIEQGIPAAAVMKEEGPGFSWFVVEKGSGTWNFETEF